MFWDPTQKWGTYTEYAKESVTLLDPVFAQHLAEVGSLAGRMQFSFSFAFSVYV